MIATISPNTSNCDNTLNTLRYADRVKAMKNSNGPASFSSAGESAAPVDSDEYYASNVDPSYEDDSGDRAYDDASADSGYGWHAGNGYQPRAQEILREEDEYADDMDDVFDPVVAPTYHHQQQQQPRVTQMRRPSLEERFEQEISSAHVPSIMDEQPLFLDEAPSHLAASALRSPRSYGSPAAKSFVASRMVPKSPTSTSNIGRHKPPAASKLNGLLARSSRRARGEEGDEEGDGEFAAAATAPVGEPVANTYRLTRSHSRRHQADQPAAYAPAMPRSSSMDVMNPAAPVMSPPLAENLNFARSSATRARASTQSSVTITEQQRRGGSSPYTSAVSLPSDSNSPKEDDEKDDYDDYPVQGVELLASTMTTAAPVDSLCVSEVEQLVRLHRAEIRATTEACKEETALIGTYTSFNYAQLATQAKARDDPGSVSMTSSRQNHAEKYHLDVNSGAVVRLEDGLVFDSVDEAKIQEAREYLEHLDAVLARKQQLVVDLRMEIRKFL
ncbi:hypothetical protein IWW38_004929 [Coemansia aciculifera]|uniref:Uncharacterized protein n=1 Tax=Coemansia aciculifera TaxID=417176 RepID=A0ACC1LY08_9FUNG|nr:hypothetical protein IWW38_004929 [Coemansia aciculifera]